MPWARVLDDAANLAAEEPKELGAFDYSGPENSSMCPEMSRDEQDSKVANIPQAYVHESGQPAILRSTKQEVTPASMAARSIVIGGWTTFML